MTTIVQDEVGSLPLEFEETMKLYDAEKYCPKLNINATFDIDASIKLGLDAQYGYYFEGAILPTPSLIASYGYFSIHPAAAVRILNIGLGLLYDSDTFPRSSSPSEPRL